MIFPPKSKIQTFFRPKSSDLQKKKKKKRSSPKFKAIFLPKFRNFKRFRGGSFRMGGAIFNFSPKIGLKSTKNMRFCILHKPMGGARAPPAPPPWLRYWLFLYIPEHRFYQKIKYKMRNRGEGLVSISQLPITSLKRPSICPLIISFSIK